jgi:hypothetical protein
VYETTTATIPFVANTRFLSMIIIGGGGGGGGGRFGLSTGASGGGGGAGCGVYVVPRMPINMLRAFGANRLSVTIGAGGTGGAGGATDGTSGTNGTSGGTTHVRFSNLQVASTGDPEGNVYTTSLESLAAPGGNGGALTIGQGGTASSQYPYGGFGGQTGGTGNATVGSGGITQSLFPYNRGAGGGSGGSGKGTGQMSRLAFPASMGYLQASAGSNTRGLNGFDAQTISTFGHNELVSMLRFPDALELIHYMPVGGGGGQGGDTTLNTAGGNGGLGWHGSGGGGGGGASGGQGGNGANGGNGVVYLCWEYE